MTQSERHTQMTIADALWAASDLIVDARKAAQELYREVPKAAPS